MKIKTNIRAGKGGASGVGQNSKNTGADSVDPIEVEAPEPAPVYYPPVGRCVGI